MTKKDKKDKEDKPDKKEKKGKKGGKHAENAAPGVFDVNGESIAEPYFMGDGEDVANNTDDPTFAERLSSVWVYFVSVSALVICIILTIYTHQVFQLAGAQSDASLKAAEAALDAAKTAKNTLVEMRRFNDSSLVIQTKMVESAIVYNQAQIAKEDKELRAQIKSIKQAQNTLSGLKQDKQTRLKSGDTVLDH